MMTLPFCWRLFSRWALLSLVALAGVPKPILRANDISGTVQNLSRRLPAALDDVILLRLQNGLQEEARAKTDAQGRFTLVVQYPRIAHLVRVVHQGITYDQNASAGDTLSIQVFDSASQVSGITGNIEILRAGTNGNLLHVSDLIQLKNESSPPFTKAGDRTFDIYLHPEARIDSVLAAGPNEAGIAISAAHVLGEPGHYTVNFPLRPGATKFAFNYDIPYAGSVKFQTKHAYALERFALLLPPGMKFSSPNTAFKNVAMGGGRYQVVSVAQLNAGEGPAFEVSGSGPPPHSADMPISGGARSAADSFVPDHPRFSSLPSIDSHLRQSQLTSQSALFGAVTAILLALCAFQIWRARKTRSISSTQAVARQPSHSQRSTS